jgi:hypothetical protein
MKLLDICLLRSFYRLPQSNRCDDDDVVRFTLKKVLEQHDFDVTTAAKVPEALKHVSAGAKIDRIAPREWRGTAE